MAPPFQKSVKSPTEQDGGHGPTNANAQKSVVIREPVAVTVRTDWWNRLYVIFTGILVIVGSAGVVMAYVTLKAIRRQVDVLVKVERPWILAVIGEMLPAQVSGEQDSFGGIPPIYAARCTLKNFGRTAARIDSWIATRAIVTVEPLPPEPDYSSAQSAIQVLPPGESLNMLLPWTTEQVQQAHRDTLFLYVYGFVSYKDGFGDSHETRFCCRYYPPFRDNKIQGFHVAGPDAYNRQT